MSATHNPFAITAIDEAMKPIHETFESALVCLCCENIIAPGVKAKRPKLTLDDFVCCCTPNEDKLGGTEDGKLMPCCICRYCAVSKKHHGDQPWELNGAQLCKVCPFTNAARMAKQAGEKKKRGGEQTRQWVVASRWTRPGRTDIIRELQEQTVNLQSNLVTTARQFHNEATKAEQVHEREVAKLKKLLEAANATPPLSSPAAIPVAEPASLGIEDGQVANAQSLAFNDLRAAEYDAMASRLEREEYAARQNVARLRHESELITEAIAADAEIDAEMNDAALKEAEDWMMDESGDESSGALDAVPGIGDESSVPEAVLDAVPGDAGDQSSVPEAALDAVPGDAGDQSSVPEAALDAVPGDAGDQSSVPEAALDAVPGDAGDQSSVPLEVSVTGATGGGLPDVPSMDSRKRKASGNSFSPSIAVRRRGIRVDRRGVPVDRRGVPVDYSDIDDEVPLLSRVETSAAQPPAPPSDESDVEDVDDLPPKLLHVPKYRLAKYNAFAGTDDEWLQLEAERKAKLAADRKVKASAAQNYEAVVQQLADKIAELDSERVLYERKVEDEKKKVQRTRDACAAQINTQMKRMDELAKLCYHFGVSRHDVGRIVNDEADADKVASDYPVVSPQQITAV